MARPKKLAAPVTLFAAIERQQHEVLRKLAFDQRRSLADVTRDALAEYIRRHVASRTSTRPLRRAATR